MSDNQKITQLKFLINNLRSSACQKLIYSDHGVNKYLKDDKLSDIEKIKNIKKMSNKYSDCTIATVFLELTNQKDKTIFDPVSDYN
jgi:hypothetical protein